jgi:hypothetical protein
MAERNYYRNLIRSRVGLCVMIRQDLCDNLWFESV